MLVVTNRNIQQEHFSNGIGDEEAFGEGCNEKGPNELRLAHAQRKRVEAVVFSWPANPGGFPVDEYRQARRIAQASFGALDALFEKFGNYLREDEFDKEELLGCMVTVNLMTYSLGNYLFQNYVLSNEYADETRMFTNVVLCQADVDSAGHPAWVERVVAGQRICVTINENDKILGFSEAVNYARLGKTVANLEARNAQYYDFTGGARVGNRHQLWGEVNTALAKKFFGTLFAGGRPEDAGGFDFDARVNAWRIRR